MKIKKEHYVYLEKEIHTFLEQHPKMVEDYETGNFIRSECVKDLQMRFCFDILYSSGLGDYVCSVLYPYIDDDHVYTALRNILPKVERRY